MNIRKAKRLIRKMGYTPRTVHYYEDTGDDYTYTRKTRVVPLELLTAWDKLNYGIITISQYADELRKDEVTIQRGE